VANFNGRAHLLLQGNPRIVKHLQSTLSRHGRSHITVLLSEVRLSGVWTLPRLLRAGLFLVRKCAALGGSFISCWSSCAAGPAVQAGDVPRHRCLGAGTAQHTSSMLKL
jgi:hypothetical protein